METCVHCGRICHDPKGGYASVGPQLPVCHPNVPDRPDCYHMITVYGHQVENCLRCTENPYAPLSSKELHDAMMESLRRFELIVRDALP